MSTATALAALAQFRGVARSVVREWCQQHPEGAMCSIDTVFDLILDNHHAEVPEEYYNTIRLMSNCAHDQDILSCSEVAQLYNMTVTQDHSKVDAWLDGNTVVTGAQSVQPDAQPQQRVWVAHTTVRKKGSARAQGNCKWILTKAPRSPHDSEEPEESHLASGFDAPSTSATSAESESQTPCRAESFYHSSDLETLEPYPDATPEAELRQLWALPRVKQGFWPEVGNCQNSHGCICWRCWHDCKIEIPLHVMVPV